MPIPPKYSACPPSRIPLTNAPVRARRKKFVMVCWFLGSGKCGVWSGIDFPTYHFLLPTSCFLMPPHIAEQFLDIENQHDIALAGHGYARYAFGAESIKRLDHHIIVPGKTIRRQDETVVAELHQHANFRIDALFPTDQLRSEEHRQHFAAH